MYIARKRILDHPTEFTQWCDEAQVAGTPVPYWCPSEEWVNWIHDDTIDDFRPVVPGEELPAGAYWTPAAHRKKWTKYVSGWKTETLLVWHILSRAAANDNKLGPTKQVGTQPVGSPRPVPKVPKPDPTSDTAPLHKTRILKPPPSDKQTGKQKVESPRPAPKVPKPDPTSDTVPLSKTRVLKPLDTINETVSRPAQSAKLDHINSSITVPPASKPPIIIDLTNDDEPTEVLPPAPQAPLPIAPGPQSAPQRKKKRKPTKPTVPQAWIDARKPKAVEVQRPPCTDPTKRQEALDWINNWFATERRRPHCPRFPERKADWWPAALERMIDHWPAMQDWMEDGADTGTNCPYWVPHWEWPNWMYDASKGLHRPLAAHEDPNVLREQAPYWVPEPQRKHWMNCGYTPRLWISRLTEVRRVNRAEELVPGNATAAYKRYMRKRREKQKAELEQFQRECLEARKEIRARAEKERLEVEAMLKTARRVDRGREVGSKRQ